jgi:hypothetical protein
VLEIKQIFLSPNNFIECLKRIIHNEVLSFQLLFADEEISIPSNSFDFSDILLDLILIFCKIRVNVKSCCKIKCLL